MDVQHRLHRSQQVVLHRTLRVHHVDGPLPSLHRYHSTAASHTSEEGLEIVDSQRGALDNEAQVLASGQQAAQEAKEEVGWHGALVRLVHDDDGVGGEKRVGQCLSQHHAVGHEEEARAVEGRRLGAVVEADAVADVDAEVDAHLLGHASGDGHGGDAARLGDGHLTPTSRPARGIQVLRHLYTQEEAGR